eukprot:COSAG05_NODE_11199_length_525_cov_1.086854_1_plen_58_part_10
MKMVNPIHMVNVDDVDLDQLDQASTPNGSDGQRSPGTPVTLELTEEEKRLASEAAHAA